MFQSRMKEILDVSPLIPVCVIDDIDKAEPLANALIEGGVFNIEVTLRTPKAAVAMRVIKGCYPQVTVGAGTVFNEEQVKSCADAGAAYIVSPGYSEEVHMACEEQRLPYLPGAVTPTEIQALQAKGFKYLKFFPAAAYGGVTTLKSFAPVFKDIQFCATGGVGLDDIAGYLSLPNVAALGMSALTPSRAIAEDSWDEITAIAKDAMALGSNL